MTVSVFVWFSLPFFSSTPPSLGRRSPRGARGAVKTQDMERSSPKYGCGSFSPQPRAISFAKKKAEEATSANTAVRGLQQQGKPKKITQTHSPERSFCGSTNCKKKLQKKKSEKRCPPRQRRGVFSGTGGRRRSHKHIFLKQVFEARLRRNVSDDVFLENFFAQMAIVLRAGNPLKTRFWEHSLAKWLSVFAMAPFFWKTCLQKWLGRFAQTRGGCRPDGYREKEDKRRRLGFCFYDVLCSVGLAPYLSPPDIKKKRRRRFSF